MDSLLALPSDQLTRIVVFVVALLVIWVVLRTIMRVTMRIFTLGCGAILVLGLILVFLGYLNR